MIALSAPAPDPWTEYIDSALVWEPLARVPLKAGASVLDVGSGDGRIVGGLRRQGLRAVGMELRPGPGTDVIGRAEALPFRTESFDLVLMVLVLMHVPAGQRALEEIHRVTKRGGKVLLAVGNRRSFTGLAFRERSPRFLRRKIPYDYYVSYSDRELAGALEKAGFRLRSMRSVTYIPRVIGKAPQSLLRGLIPLLGRAENSMAGLPILGKVGVRLVAVAERP